MRHKHLNKKVPLEQKAAPYLIYIELSTIDVIKKLTTNGSTVSTVLLKFAVFAELFPLLQRVYTKFSELSTQKTTNFIVDLYKLTILYAFLKCICIENSLKNTF